MSTESETKKVANKIYFIHRGYFAGAAADFFVWNIKEIKDEDDARRRYHVDYYLPDCEYVVAFLKNNPKYVYVGSTDNDHLYGWGMSFKGYRKVKCPKL